MKAAAAAAAFEGHGAAKYPGRWNPMGVRVVYAAENRSLAALEVLANAGERDVLTKAKWSIVSVHFDQSLVHAPSRIPNDWQKVPAPDSTRVFGGNWVTKATSVVLKVPSAVTLGEFCYVLNPLHPDFAKVEIGAVEAFSFNARTL